MGKFGQQLAVERERFARGEISKSQAWGMYFRRTMPDLKEAIDRGYSFFQDIDPDATFNVNDHTWTIPSCGDAKFEYAHIENEASRFKYKSRNLTYVYIDELTEFTRVMWEYMDTRIRTVDPVLEPMLQLCAGSNPDGPGLLWVRKQFIENKVPEVVYRKMTRLEDGRLIPYDQVFIPAKLSDNPILYASGRYEASLRNKRPEVREAILNGNWYINPGAYFANIWDTRYHVVPNHDVPRNARIWRSCDPGIANPASVTWYYEDRDGGLTGIHNLYVRNHDAAMLAGRIREIETHYGWWDEESNRSSITGPMDEDAFNRNLSGGPTYARVMAQCGVRWLRSRKDRFNGISEVVRRMNARVKSIHPGEDDRPLIRWMERCRAPIETIPVLQADPNNPEDVDTKGEDHAYDDLMYICLHRMPRHVEETQDDDDEDIVDLDRYRERRYRSGSMGVPPGGW
jgi:hypothetical protein